LEKISIDVIEKELNDQLQFLNIVIQQVRKRNEFLRQILGPTYAKLIGLGTPYEECIHSLRQVYNEFKKYLEIVRNRMIEESRRNSQKRGRRKSF